MNGFQLRLVTATNWAAYGYPHCEHMAVIGLLKCRGQLAQDEVTANKSEEPNMNRWFDSVGQDPKAYHIGPPRNADLPGIARSHLTQEVTHG